MVLLFLKKKAVLLSFVLACMSINAYGLSYVTIADGDWNDPAIWSTDGGATACGCIPPEPTVGNDIRVNHVVDLLSSSITVTGGSQIIIAPYVGELHWSGPGGGTINVQDGQLYVNNYIAINQLNISANGNVTIVGYSEMYVEAGFDVYGSLHIYGGYLTVASGNLKFMSSADVQLTHFSKLEVVNGNLSNEGSVFIAGNSCIETDGAWVNENTGTVSGNGSAHALTGAFKNFNVWQASVNWCGGGNPQNMPPEDCAGAQNACGMLVLGAAFGEFEALVVNENEVDLFWTTVSERDNDYFMVQRSSNGVDFETIGFVDGNGTTEWELDYEFVDPAPYKGVSYYKLKQVDLDGYGEDTPMKSVQINTEELVIISSYNLMGQEINDNYSGVVIDLLEDGTTRKRFKP